MPPLPLLSALPQQANNLPAAFEPRAIFARESCLDFCWVNHFNEKENFYGEGVHR